MDKCSSDHILCRYCDKEAIPDTYPPVCADHVELSKTASEGSTLKELENDHSIWGV